MAKELDLYGGNNPANDKDAQKNGVSQTTGQVKALNTGHTETSLKKKLRAEVDEAWRGNHGLLSNLFNIFGGILKTGGKIVGGAIAGVGDFFSGVIDGVQSFVQKIGNAFNGKGSFEAIEGPVQQRLGPIDTAITQQAQHFTDLSREVDAAIAKQKKLTTQQEQLTERADNIVSQAEQDRKTLELYETRRKQDLAGMTNKATAAQQRADSAVSSLAAYKKSEEAYKAEQARKLQGITNVAEDAQTRAAKLVTAQGQLTPLLKNTQDNASNAVRDLKKLSNDFSSYKSSQADTITTLRKQAQSGISKADTAQQSLNTLNTQLAGKIATGVKNHQDVKDAKRDADKAVTDLKNMADIGASLIPLVPGTRTPAWTEMSTVVKSSTTYQNQIAYRGPNRQTTQIAPTRHVKVAPDTVYKVAFYAKASTANTRLYIELRDSTTGALAVAQSTQNGNSKTPWVNSSYPIDNFQLTTGWKRYEWLIKFKPEVQEVYLSRFYWNHPNGTGTGYQYIAGLEIAPHIDQATIDRLQNEAIFRTEKLAGTNANMITVLQGSWETQQTINKKQGDWNTGAETAIRANTAMLQLAFPDVDLTPRYSDKRPRWSSGMTYKQWLQIFDTLPSLPAYYMPPTETSATDQRDAAFFPVHPGIDLRVRWAFKFDSDAASTGLTVRLYGRKNGETRDREVITHVQRLKWQTGSGKTAKTGDMNQSMSAATRIGLSSEPRNIWVHQDAVVRIADGIDEVRVQFNTNSNSGVIIAGPFITPFAPLQAELDAAQSKAIESLEKHAAVQTQFTTQQREINKANTETDEAQNKAIAALARRDVGQSLILYEDLTEAERAAARKSGKIPAVYKPSWATATQHYRDLNSSDAGFIQAYGQPHPDMWGVSASSGTRDCARNFMRVEPGKQYKLAYWHRATRGNSRYYIQMYSGDGQPNPFRVVTFDSKGGEKKTTPTTYAVNNQIMPTSWQKNEVILEIEPGVTELTFARFYWNHPNGKNSDGSHATANQWIAGMDFGPNIPTQAEVDKAQNEAIATNTMAIKMLGRLDPGESLIGYLEPSEADLKNPKKRVDWDIPAWSTASTISGSHTEVGKWWGYRGAKTSRATEKIMRPVRPNTPYKLTFYGYGTGSISIKVDTSPGGGIRKARLYNGLDADGKRKYRTMSAGNSYAARLVKLPGSKWEKYEIEVEFAQNVTEACISGIYWNDDGSSGEQRLGLMDFGPNIPTQAEVDKAQNEAIDTLKKHDKLSQNFQKQQTLVNELVQEQLWQHQDMIELLDIRAAKQYGTPSMVGYKVTTTTPYFTAVNTDANVVRVECYGDWVGTIRVTANTDAGLVDDYVCEVTPTVRKFKITGGRRVQFRSAVYQVFVTSLRRKVTFDLARNTVTDYDGLVRSVTHINGTVEEATTPSKTYTSVKEFRLKNGTTADNTSFTYYTRTGAERKLGKGGILPATLFPISALKGANVTTLTEVTDQSTTYKVNSELNGTWQYL